MNEGVELAEVITRLRQDLTKAKNQAAGDEISFSVGDIELEFQFVVTKSGEASAGIKFWVVNAEAGGTYENAVTQKLKLKLTPNNNGAPLIVSAPDKD